MSGNRTKLIATPRLVLIRVAASLFISLCLACAPAAADTLDLEVPGGWNAFSPWFTSNGLPSSFSSNNVAILEYTGGGFSEIAAPSQVVPGSAYWVYTDSETPVQVTDASMFSQSSFTWNLVQGWNFIGNPYSCTLPATNIKLDDVVFSESTAGADGFYSYSDGAGYSKADTIPENEGCWVYSPSALDLVATEPNCGLGVTASISPESGTTEDSYTLSCTVSGGSASLLEGRCDTADGWAAINSGIIKTCTYSVVGQFTPGCRMDGTDTDDADEPITVFESLQYAVVGTQQTACYDDMAEITCPDPGVPFFGQDAQAPSRDAAYLDNGDGTVTDLNTGLMWVQARGTKVDWDTAMSGTSSVTVGGYSDWRVPTIKELYSLIDFSGEDMSGYEGTDTSGLVPFIDDSVFEHEYGDPDTERLIDCQGWTATQYVSTTMMGDETVFGVNFCDGRIKGYPKIMMIPPDPPEPKEMFIRYVRGNPNYGMNNFTDNADGTITDAATGLMWAKDDSGSGMNWQEALAYVETQNTASYLGHNDWRLPDIKELHSIVDYMRSPDTTASAAIDPMFNATSFTDEGGGTNYPFYWSSTTHKTMGGGGEWGTYMTFGEALGFMEDPPPGSGTYTLMDVHGAGAQRSDPKNDDPANYPNGHGPQGDVIRVDNYVRLVRNSGP